MSETAYKDELRRLAGILATGDDIRDDVALLARRAALSTGAVLREIGRLS